LADKYSNPLYLIVMGILMIALPSAMLGGSLDYIHNIFIIAGVIFIIGGVLILGYKFWKAYKYK